MAVHHGRKGKLERREKRKYEGGSDYIPVFVGEEEKKEIRTFGGNKKDRMLYANKANVLIDKTYQQCDILKVINNPASQDLSRRKVITKGVLLTVKNKDKELKVKVVSRPGQDGVVNAVVV